MFYPVDSLKRGGRFYLCWVADSWPLRFATVTHRQLWSQDVRRVCDDLLDVMTNESGRPTNRFSLRLSSQLMRGLVRLYQKKVDVFLSDLCMINANVTRHINKKYNIPKAGEVSTPRSRPQVVEPLPQIVLPEEPENEQHIEEIIRNSGNVVSNLQEITLREATIPEILLPPNDGFGEENPDQALVGDRTMEMMLVPTEPSGHHSVLELALDLTDKSHDKSRRAPDRQMERISEHDVTIFTKSHGEELIPGGDFEKEIQIPDIPDIPIPEVHIPQEQLPLDPEIVEPQRQVVERPTVQEPEEIELEELEDAEPQAKRRRLRKIIIDKKTKIGANILRARIDNPSVELRCENSSDDIGKIRVPLEVYMRRPCHAGPKIHTNLALEITRLFMRNLGVVNRSPRAERDFQEEIMYLPKRARTISILGRIDEVEEPPIPIRAQPQIEQNITFPENITHQDIVVQDVNLSKDNLPQMDVQKEVDIGDMMTQKIDTLTQQARKRKSTLEDKSTPKRQRCGGIGYVSFGESQKNRHTAMDTTVPVVMEPETHPAYHMDKENVPENMQNVTEARPSKDANRSVTAMLQQAGLADIQPYQPVEPPVTSQRKSSVLPASERSETPLGSLDRTKVSLGDSEQTTDSMRFIRDQWGTEGAMMKILKFMREGLKPVTVRTLISAGPVLAGYKSIMAARCFTSILKLKQHGFIIIKKCPDSLEIEDIVLGEKFY